jgi:hypothetical protein
MGFSTMQIDKGTVGFNYPEAELVSTSDNALFQYLGEKIKPITVGREYHNAPIRWELSDDGRLIAFYNDMFAEFEV